MYQSTTPSFSQTIWPRWASRQFLSLPLVQNFAPCDFCLFPKLRGCRYKTRDERRCDEGRWHAHTRGLLWGVPEVVGTVQQVHCSRRRLLLRVQEFRVYAINKSAHTKKRSGNLFIDPRMSRVKCRFIAIIPRSTLIQSWLYLLGSYIGQIDLFKNYSHLIGPWAKWSHLKNNFEKYIHERDSLTCRYKITLYG